MFSKLMSQVARKDKASEGFGYRYDDELNTLVNNAGSTALVYEVNAENYQVFKTKSLFVLNHWPAYFPNLSIFH